MSNKKIVNYVRTRNKNLFEHNFKQFQVLINDPLPENVDIKLVFNQIQDFVPSNFLKLIDVVYVGDFPFLNEREITSMFSDGALYISNQQDNNQDLKDDILHEISHAVEEKYNDFLYNDEEIKNEYFAKLKKLKSYLIFEGYHPGGIEFFNIHYNEEFDNFLLNTVGYDKLGSFIAGLFINPYSLTSLREYFATGFEEYFLGDQIYLSKVCPYLFNKLSFLNEAMEDE